MRSIFSEIEVISGYNKLLLKLLKERMEKWTEETTLGDIFGKIVNLKISLSLFVSYFFFQQIDYLKTYTQYVNNFNKALFTIHTYEKNERFVQFLQMCKSDPKCNQLDLSQFLIMPVRIEKKCI